MQSLSQQPQPSIHTSSPIFGVDPIFDADPLISDPDLQTPRTKSGIACKQAPTFCFAGKNGATDGDRTRDTQIHNLVL